MSRFIGLTGGIATGKSTVTKMLRELGAHVLDADEIAREVVAPGTRGLEEIAADEIVSGSFKNIAGVVTAVNAAAGTLTLSDLATKKPVELKVTAESQMRKLPDRMAQAIAMRLKGMGAGAGGGTPAAGQPGHRHA